MKKKKNKSSLSRKNSASSAASCASAPPDSSSSSCDKTARDHGIHHTQQQDKAFVDSSNHSKNGTRQRTNTATATGTAIGTAGAEGHGDNGNENDNNNNNNKKKDQKQPLSPFRRDPFSEFIQSRLGTAFTIFMIALLCDIFLAKPILHQKGLTEVQLLQEIMQKTTGVNFENTLRFINASIPIGGGAPDPKLRPGYTLAQQGATAKYPVVLIPGFITSGLELWQGEDCAKRHFRQRLWGSLPIFVQSFFTDMKCWSRHLALDPLTGGDPESIRLRSAQGFEAADYFMSTYWVWDKIIENLSEVGYDSSNMIMMSYDWRLSFDTLERRDGYLTKLKMNIEAMVKTTAGKKVVIASHSMGSQIVLYFFKWVTTEEKYGGGGGGVDWVEKHCAKFVNIAGPLLGVPKAVPALLSGEMKDTAALLGPMGNMVERVFGKKDRKELWTTWGSLWEMLPKGGDEIWGGPYDIITAQYDPPLTESSELSERLCHNVLSLKDNSETAAAATTTTTDEFCQQPEKAQVSHASNVVDLPHRGSDRDDPSNTKSSFITFTTQDTEDSVHDHPREGVDSQKSINSSDNVNEKLDMMDREWSITESIEYLRKSGGGYGHNLHASKSISPRPDSDTWNNPLVTPLPNAPSMKIYCLYGVGIETERAYFYRRLAPLQSNNNNNNNDEHNFPFVLDGTMNDPENHIHFGSKSSDGDVSVPLISLGYLCANKWKTSKQLNPSDIHVITREYKHREEFQVNDPMRGGPYSSDHVDILGNVDAMTDLIKVVTDHDVDQIQDKIVSDIESISNKINNVPEINDKTFDPSSFDR